MGHVALYRKYRSQTFGDLVGQEHVVRTLQNGIASGSVHHAFLFTGPRGTGKTSTARLLAKALNCESGPCAEPCNVCEHCRSITAGSCMDVIEMDAASESSVDQVREKIVQVADYRPAVCRYKVFIIDEVHDLSDKAFDALLKTVEEPPGHLIFVLATTEYGKVPPTIRSRCQKFEFHRATLGDLQSRLQHVVEGEGFEAEPAALAAIARLADGGYRDALTLLEQAVLTAEGPLTLQHVYDQLGLIPDEVVDDLLTALAEADPKPVIERLDAIYRRGRDPASILDSMLHRLSELTRAAYGVELGAGAEAAVESSRHALAQRLGPVFLARAREKIAEAKRAVQTVSLPRLWLEAEMLALAIPAAPAARAAPATTREAQEKPQAKPEAAAAPAAFEASGDPDLDAARQAWAEVVASLGAKSRVAMQRLSGARLASLEGGVARVVFLRQIDHDKLKDNANLLGAIDAEWRPRTEGRGWKLKFGVDAAPGASPSDAAVELPLTGERLVQAVRDVFEGA
jgi:DNA polymerase-3 subunit gamma/tau